MTAHTPCRPLLCWRLSCDDPGPLCNGFYVPTATTPQVFHNFAYQSTILRAHDYVIITL